MAFLTSFAAFPWVVKPLYGFLSDTVPIFGYRRRSYLVICGALGESAAHCRRCRPSLATIRWAHLECDIQLLQSRFTRPEAGEVSEEKINDGGRTRRASLWAACGTLNAAVHACDWARCGPAKQHKRRVRC